VNRDAIAQEVIRVLRRTLSGSSREININDPLGELGLGLDSLALVEFVTVLENRFQVVIPESIWTEKGLLAVQHFVDIIAERMPPDTARWLPGDSQPALAPNTGSSTPPAAPLPTARESSHRLNFFLEKIRQRWQAIYTTEKFFVLEFNLLQQSLPTYSSPLPLILRRATSTDDAALEKFWNAFPYLTIDKQEMNMELFRRRLQTGYICLTAWLGDQIVGMDWLVQNSYDCPYTGLRFDWPPSSCYAGELYEHPSFKGKGVGLAVLAYSLAESRNAGFQRQVAWVTEKNVKMLSASIQLFGFRNIGEIYITNIFRKPMSKWKIRDRRGWGGTVVI
jgi:acyl carrier protein/GNAT superfamily N-acetyltransferase